MMRKSVRKTPPVKRAEVMIVKPGSTRPVATVAAQLGALEGQSGLVLLNGAGDMGKEEMAEIAAVLGRPVHRIDLSAVVSRYIGETEKALDTVLAKAQRAGAVLLVEDADALFGSRSEVRDSHDRHADLDTAVLLERLASHDGLIVVASQGQAGLDPAFIRRVRMRIDFPASSVRTGESDSADDERAS